MVTSDKFTKSAGHTESVLLYTVVREPGGPTVHPPPPPPPLPGTFHNGPKMYFRVSRTQSHLLPGHPLEYTGVIALCARVPSCLQSVDFWSKLETHGYLCAKIFLWQSRAITLRRRVFQHAPTKGKRKTTVG